ncbi:hypothetical protein CRYUN_Cryun32bG0062000 [Craigia yunnanensis]
MNTNTEEMNSQGQERNSQSNQGVQWTKITQEGKLENYYDRRQRQEHDRYNNKKDRRLESASRRNGAVQDWRSRLFTVLIDKLSQRVPKSALWKVLCEYGNVVDVYIPRLSKMPKKGTTFAFVSWKERRYPEQRLNKKNGENDMEGKAYNTLRDNRSYRDVLLEHGKQETVVVVKKAVSDTGEFTSSDSEELPPLIPKKVNYDLDIPKSEMEWLDRSAIVRIRKGCHLKDVVKEVATERFKVSICPMGGVTTLLTFDTKIRMAEQLNNDKMKTWFYGLYPWGCSTRKKGTTVWVMLEEVPLQVWHEKFFASLGNSRGHFVCLDDNTMQRKRHGQIISHVEEVETVVRECPGCTDASSSDEEDDRIENLFAGELNDVAYSRGSGFKSASHELDICPWLEQDHDVLNMGYPSILSAEELIGGGVWSGSQELVFDGENDGASANERDVGPLEVVESNRNYKVRDNKLSHRRKVVKSNVKKENNP